MTKLYEEMVRIVRRLSVEEWSTSLSTVSQSPLLQLRTPPVLMESEGRPRHSQSVRRKDSGGGASQRRRSEEEDRQISVNTHRNEENIPHSFTSHPGYYEYSPHRCFIVSSLDIFNQGSSDNSILFLTRKWNLINLDDYRPAKVCKFANLQIVIII